MEKGDKGNIQVSRTRRHQDVTNLSGPWDNEWWRVYWTHGRITTAKQILNLKDNRRIRRKLAYSNLVQQHTHTQTQTKRQTNENKPTQTLGHELKNSDRK